MMCERGTGREEKPDVHEQTWYFVRKRGGSNKGTEVGLVIKVNKIANLLYILQQYNYV